MTPNDDRAVLWAYFWAEYQLYLATNRISIDAVENACGGGDVEMCYALADVVPDLLYEMWDNASNCDGVFAYHVPQNLCSLFVDFLVKAEKLPNRDQWRIMAHQASQRFYSEFA
ncbi:hypothetical protein [Ferrimonas balearica]|uniref:hypothetical protein n=1 Tax=Ferrimonas balearica TaxID=44012 RepID=UPI001F426217|nr:hypothetical protein [Ferrimonas balearica]MBY6093813.1 hypothetical protein [Ferrimonas balearica]